MPPLKDLTGQRFGRLTVIGREPGNYVSPDGFVVITRWRCRCDCGNETVVLRTNLKRGLTRSCGCLRRERMKEKMGVQHGRCRNCDFYPEPDGIAHKCSYWERMTNSEGYCSNWRPKS